MSSDTYSPTDIPTLADIRAARTRIKGIITETPLDYSKTFSDLSNNDIYLKLENLQKTGSFKLRGAYNKIASLSAEERQRGVIAASAGNHAQGVAYAARVHDAPCTIVMPESASLAKVAATQHYGATVVLAGDSYDAAYARALELQHEHGYTFVHAFDDPLIVAGQGTVGLEILEQLPTVSAIVIPMGGGGLACGIALAAKTLKPDIKIYGVEASSVPSFRKSFDEGCLTAVVGQPTIADGIAVQRPGTLTYQIAKDFVDDVVTVEEEEIARTMVMLMERSKLVTEGAAASAMAAILYRKIPENLGDVVVVLSGGNVDVTMLSRIIENGLSEAGRFVRLEVKISDKPGGLRDLLDVFANLGASVYSVVHHRVGAGISLGQTMVEVDLETKDNHHIEVVLEQLRRQGYEPIRHQ